MNMLLTAATTLSLIIATHTAHAGDIKAGEELAKTRMCAGCHGLNGISPMPVYPHLAGQHEAYLIKALTDFREKRRIDPTMNAMAGGLSDDDIANAAAFFSSQPR